MKWLIQLIVELLKVFKPDMTPKNVEGAGPGETEKELQDKLKEQGW